MGIDEFYYKEPPPDTMTHRQAVRRVSNWLKNVKHYTVVITELTTRNSETPDVIGWQGAASTLIEVKVSRSDFLSDKNKHFRRYEKGGMGDRRYYACPPGLIMPCDVPQGWGLLEIGKNRIYRALIAKPKPSDKNAEIIMLVSAIRRLRLSTAVYVIPEEEIENAE